MTVSELIATLSTCSPNAEVVFHEDGISIHSVGTLNHPDAPVPHIDEASTFHVSSPTSTITD